jgi:hypothetical protein
MDGLELSTAALDGADSATASPPPLPVKASDAADARRMVRGELYGRATYSTSNAIRVHIWRRGDKYLARGRYQRRQFMQVLGKDPGQAEAALRKLQGDLESGAFIPPAEARKRPLKNGIAPRLSLRELFDEFLRDVRRVRGLKTFQDYRARLTPALEFGEMPAHRKRWPLAADIDRGFAVEFKAWLHGRVTARNGHPVAEQRPMSRSQIHNILGCVATALHWGRRPDVNRLPSYFANPFTRDLVGKRPTKDPLRPQMLPIDLRVEMVARMDLWQLCALALPFTLPNRPEDFAGLLVSEVNFAPREMVFGTRLGGSDYNKCGFSFRLAWPAELEPILRRLIGTRGDGPLILRRTAVEGRRIGKVSVANSEDINRLFEQRVACARPGEVQALADRKRIFRRVLLDLGGVSTDGLAREFKTLLVQVRPGEVVRFYETRSATTNDLKDAGVDAVFRHYLTAHSMGREILGSYESQDLHLHMGKYFDYIRPLLTAIADRAAKLGVR